MVECCGGVVCVYGVDDEVVGFGGGDCYFDGFEVVEFVDDDDVGVFVEGVFEGGGEGFGVWVDFVLGYVVIVCGLDDFDGIFDGDDVIFVFVV